MIFFSRKKKAQEDPLDIVCCDVPLFIRILELSREEIVDDAQLHVVVDRILTLSKRGSPLTMDNYQEIIQGLKFKEHQ